MSKIAANIRCRGCDMETPITIRKPTLMKPVVLTTTCKNCESEMLVKVSIDRSRAPAEGETPLTFSGKITRPGAALLEAQNEIAAEAVGPAAPEATP